MGVSSIVKGLEEIVTGLIDENIGQFRESEEFLIETRYGNRHYQLDEIDPSEDLCLQGLIHYILYEEGFYEKFLNDSQFDHMKYMIGESPYYIYFPDPDSNEGSHDEVIEDIKALETIEEIHHRMILFVARTLMNHGFDVPVLEEYLEESDEEVED